MVAAEVPGALAGAVDSVAVSDGEDLVGASPPVRPRGAFDPRQGEGTEYQSLAERTGTPEGCEEGQNASSLPPYYGFTPNQYLTAYGHRALHERGIRGQGQRIAVIEIDGFRRSDIEEFGRCFGITIPPISTVPVGMKDPLAPGPETTLDLEVISAAAPGARRIDVYESGGSFKDLVRTLSGGLGRPGQHPDVMSISLGTCEPLVRGKIAIWRAMNNVFALAGAAGISVFASSGDTGAAACERDGPGGVKGALHLQATQIPASSPFVTSVGGTNLALTAENRIEREIVWNDGPRAAEDFGLGAGGGGLSILEQRHPFWQKGEDFKRFGPTRAVPDISALADSLPGFAIYCGPEVCGGGTVHPGWQSFGGTSAATPLMAGGMALVNQLAKKRGRAQAGFASPLLYRIERRHPDHFNDVTVGNNDVGAQIEANKPFNCCAAEAGYDLASGLGSPRVDAIARRVARGGP